MLHTGLAYLLHPKVNYTFVPKILDNKSQHALQNNVIIKMKMSKNMLDEKGRKINLVSLYECVLGEEYRNHTNICINIASSFYRFYLHKICAIPVLYHYWISEVESIVWNA
jgi:hypothetical protein